MRKITIKNPQILDVPYTLLSSDYTSGATLSVEDSSKFADNDLILVGGIGDEKTEVTDLTATPPNDTSFTIAALKFVHDADEPVQKVLWNKYDIQYRTSSTGSWTDLATNQNFDWGNDDTIHVDNAGTSAYQYRARYYNSATAIYSDWSDVTAGSGLTRNQVGWAIKKVRKKTKTENSNDVTDKDIIDSFNTVNDIIRGLNRRWWFLKDEHEFLTVADTKAYNLPDDYQRAHRLKYRFNDGTTDVEYYLRFKTKTEFDNIYRDLDADSDDDLVHYTIDDVDETVELGPTPETAGYTCTLIYFKELDDVNTYGDILIVPLPNLYIHYACGEIWEDKDNNKKAGYHRSEFASLLKVLEQMRAKTPTPKEFKRYRGNRAMKRLYGTRRVYSDARREKYW